jgi:hypothetical protein
MTDSLFSKIDQRLTNMEEAELQEPDGDMDPEAIVVDCLDYHHRRLLTLQKEYASKAELHFAEASEALKLPNPESLAEKHLRLGAEAANMAKMLENMFWLSLRDKHEVLRGKVAVFIAKGWKIGYLENDVFMTRMNASGGGFNPMDGPSMGMVAIGSMVALACVGLLGAAIAMLVIGNMHSAGVLGLLIVAGIVGMFLMRQKEMSKKNRRR